MNKFRRFIATKCFVKTTQPFIVIASILLGVVLYNVTNVASYLLAEYGLTAKIIDAIIYSCLGYIIIVPSLYAIRNKAVLKAIDNYASDLTNEDAPNDNDKLEKLMHFVVEANKSTS